MEGADDITRLLRDWSAGDQGARDALMPLVYDELHRRAARLFRGEGKSHTLQPTALVHEAYARLVRVDISWQDRAHFFALSGRLMRRLLVNHANARRAGKRGGGALMVTLTENADAASASEAPAVQLADALAALESIDPRKVQLIEMKYFGGLTAKEIEEVTGLSPATIGRDLRFARAWLKSQLAEEL